MKSLKLGDGHVLWFSVKTEMKKSGAWMNLVVYARSQLCLHNSSFIFLATYQMSGKYLQMYSPVSSMEFLLCIKPRITYNPKAAPFPSSAICLQFDKERLGQLQRKLQLRAEITKVREKSH